MTTGSRIIILGVVIALFGWMYISANDPNYSELALLDAQNNLSAVLGSSPRIDVRDDLAQKRLFGTVFVLLGLVIGGIGFAIRRPVAATKVCPRCAEKIMSGAVICRHCQHEFAASSNSPN